MWCPLCVALEDDALASDEAASRSGVVAEPASRYQGYRFPSARLSGFDYGRGVFFVTIVTRGRVPWFGALEGGRVRAS